jgi:HEAT repeats/Putative zinc-finger
MTCDSVTKLIPLYYYGDLSPEEEDLFDQHLHECTTCTAEMERQRVLASALDRRRMEPPALLLEDCRADLMAAIAGGAPAAAPLHKPSKGPWALFLEALNLSFAGFGKMRQPAGVLALIAIGFFAARFSTSLPFASNGIGSMAMTSPDSTLATVRSVNVDQAGQVQLTVDETQRRQISGRLDDPNIQKFILAGSRGDNAAVRVAAVGLLKNPAGDQQALDALLNALADPNDGVRMKALDALKPLAGDPRVSKSLSQVLLSDPNPAVRMQVIDLIVANRNDSTVGALQNLVQHEENSGVRLKASKVLKDWNASIGTF